MSSHHSDGIKRTAELRLRVSSSFIEQIDKCWNSKEFPNSARTYPNPFNFKLDRKFTSRAEFVEFVLRCAIQMGQGDTTSWKMFKYLLNPDFQE